MCLGRATQTLCAHRPPAARVGRQRARDDREKVALVRLVEREGAILLVWGAIGWATSHQWRQVGRVWSVRGAAGGLQPARPAVARHAESVCAEVGGSEPSAERLLRCVVANLGGAGLCPRIDANRCGSMRIDADRCGSGETKRVAGDEGGAELWPRAGGLVG